MNDNKGWFNYDSDDAFHIETHVEGQEYGSSSILKKLQAQREELYKTSQLHRSRQHPFPGLWCRYGSSQYEALYRRYEDRVNAGRGNHHYHDSQTLTARIKRSYSERSQSCYAFL